MIPRISRPHFACHRVWRWLPCLALLVFVCTTVYGSGVDSRTVTFANLPFEVASIHLDQARLRLFWRNPDTGEPFADVSTLEAWGRRHGQRLLFATNAGIYDTRHEPLGLFVEDGRTLVPLNTAHGDPTQGNFSLLPNGVFAIDQSGHASVTTTREWQQAQRTPRLATQSGPMLVIDGKLNPHFIPDSTSIKWRSGVCTPDGNNVLFVVSRAPVNFHTFARLFRDRLGCRDALYLDGTLSQLYVDGSYFGPPRFMVRPWAGIFAVFVPAGSAGDQDATSTSP